MVFEDDYLNHIARIAYKDIQQDNYTYRIGEYNIYKGEEWGFCNFCKKHDCYFIVPNETIEGGRSEIPNDQEPEVDFKQEEKRYWEYMTNGADMIRLDFVMFDKLARHFYGFGKNAK